MSAIIVVGASLAGMHAAHTLRKEGFEGRLTVVDGDDRPPYDRPPLSKQLLSGEWDLERVLLPAASEQLDIDWRLGRSAVSLDAAERRIALDDGSELQADGIVVATGVAARTLPGQPEVEGVHVLRTLDDCLAVRALLDREPRRVLVVGAGFIGAEVAATCRKRSLPVTLLDVAAVPLERVLGARIGGVVADLHRAHGVDLRMGRAVATWLGEERLGGVVLDDGDDIEADVAVVGVGTVAVTGWLEGSGLVVQDGVVCDETLLAAPGIVAAGDVARWPSRRLGEHVRYEHWENAVQQGEQAARRLLAEISTTAFHQDRVALWRSEPFDPIPWFWSDQYDRKIQLAGRCGPDDDLEVVHGSLEERRFVALVGRGGVVEGVIGMNRPRHVVQLRRHVVERTPWEQALVAARDI